MPDLSPNPVATFVQSNYTSQDSATYKAAIDGGISVTKRLSAMFAPHETSPTSMKVEIDSGEILVNGLVIPKNSQQSITITPPVSASRIDMIVIDAYTGDIGIVTGTPGSVPDPPDLPSGKLPVAYVYLDSTTTFIANTMIEDKRSLWLTASAQPRDIQNQTFIKCDAGGTANDITGSITPAPSQLYDRLRVSLLTTGINTSTTPTFNLNSLGAKTIVKGANIPLVGGDIPGENFPCILEYVLSIDKWILLNPVFPPTTASYGGLSYFSTYTTVGANTWTKPQGNIKFVFVVIIGGGGGWRRGRRRTF